jgi:hypothetical protein
MLENGNVGDLGEAAGNELRTFGTGRFCAHPGCGRKLSTYNKSDSCFTHPERPKWENTADAQENRKRGKGNKKNTA